MESSKNIIPKCYISQSDIIQLFENIPCPVCHSGYNELKNLDYENGVAECECGGDNKGKTHRFLVRIVVTPIEEPETEYNLSVSNTQAAYVSKAQQIKASVKDTGFVGFGFF